MEHIAIEARPRSASATKGERKQLRRGGHIPAALFGKGIDPVLVTVEARDLMKVLHAETGVNTLIDLSLEGRRHLVRLAQVELDPVHRTFLHVGLHEMAANEARKATVPVEITGEPEDVQTGVALLETSLVHVDVRCLPDRLPAAFTLDVSDMKIGDVRYASDLPLPEGAELLTPPDTAVVSLHVKAAMVEEVAETGEEQAKEGEAA